MPVKILRACDSSAKIDSLEAEIQIFRGGPLDPQLSTPQNIRQDKLAIDEYLNVASKWTSIFAFGIKSRAAAVLRQQGLMLSVDNAERLKKYFSAIQARTSMSNLMGQPTTTEDAQIEAYLQCGACVAATFGTHPHRSCAGWSWHRTWETLCKLWAGGCKDVRKFNPARCGLSGGIKSFRSKSRCDSSSGRIAGRGIAFFTGMVGRIEPVALSGKTWHDTASALARYLDRLEGVLRIAEIRAVLPADLIPAVDQLLGQIGSPEDAMSALQQAVLRQEITGRLRSDPTLQAMDAHRIDSDFERYRQLDQQKKLLVREVISHLWISKQKDRLLSATGSRLNSMVADLRRRLTSRGERAMRLRQVISIGEQIEGGDPLFDLCPVWMASPETVAQIFPRKALFDVVVFDEASQCRLEEALPVLTRGRRVVIAGDPNQLPPTRFFESGVVQSADEEPESDQELFEIQQGQVEDLLAGR